MILKEGLQCKKLVNLSINKHSLYKVVGKEEIFLYVPTFF